MTVRVLLLLVYVWLSVVPGINAMRSAPWKPRARFALPQMPVTPGPGTRGVETLPVMETPPIT